MGMKDKDMLVMEKDGEGHGTLSGFFFPASIGKRLGQKGQDEILPDWILKFIRDNEIGRYGHEGMTDLVILPTPPRLTKEAQEEAERLLGSLERKMQVRVGFDRLNEMFRLINVLVGNSLSQKIFDLKIQALYSIFQSYPAVVFNENSCHELAVLSPFFPSAHEISKVLQKELEFFESRIGILRKIVRYGSRNS